MAANSMNFGNKVVFLNGYPITLPVNSADPGTAVAGDFYYNTTSNILRYYNGSAWSTVGASGANTTLSNLSSPVAVNQNFLPGTTGTFNIGSTSEIWDELYIDYIMDGSSGNVSINPVSRFLIDVAGAQSMDWANRDLVDATGSTISIDWANRLLEDSGGFNSVDWQNRSLNDSEGNPQLYWSTSGVQLGVPNTLSGVLGVASGSANAVITISGRATATSYNFNLPTTAGTGGQALISGGGGSTAMTWASVMTTSLPSADIWVGNGSNLAAPVAVSGDLSLANTGSFTIESIQGTTVSGTTGTGDVVFSSAPTLGSATFTGAINMSGQQINDLATPSLSGDAATKGYVDAAISGLTWKGPVQAYSNANVALTGSTPLAVDGYTVQNGDWIILSNQTTASQNYVYLMTITGSTYALTEVTGPESPTAVGDAYLIENGTAYSNTAFQVNAITPNVTFIQFAGPNTFSFTSPLLLTGNVVTIGYDNTTISVSGGNLIVKNAGIGTTQLANSAVTYAKIQNETATTLLGNPTGSSAAPSEINLGSTLAFSSSSLQTGAGTGDVTWSANSFVTEIAAIQGVTVTGTNGTGKVVFDTGAVLSAATIGTLTTEELTSPSAMSIDANGSLKITTTSAGVQRSTDGSNFITETYTDSITLVDNSGPTSVPSFQFSVSSFAGIEVTYVIEAANAAGDRRIGKIRVTANTTGTITPSCTDDYTESSDCGVIWAATNSSGTISVNYTTTNQGANRTMRADCKLLRA